MSDFLSLIIVIVTSTAYVFIHKTPDTSSIGIFCFVLLIFSFDGDAERTLKSAVSYNMVCTSH